jgi:hypothetical protein
MSFSAEMKAFISAYSAGQKINASRTDQEYKEANTKRTTATTERENDPETLDLAKRQAEASLAKTNQSMSLAGSARGDASANAALQREVLRERLKQLRQPAVQPGIGLAQDGYAPTPQGQGVLPTGAPQPALRNTLDDETDMYADGGLVPEEDEEDVLPGEAMPAQGVLPTTAATPVAPPTDVSAQSRQPRGLNGIISPALVHDATKAGMKFGIEKYGLGRGRGAVASPQQQAATRMFVQGHDGLSEEEMQAAKKTIDPEGKLTDSQRNMAALGSVYQFYANKGEPKKAEKVAFQMLQYYRNASQRYAAIAAKAAEGGNVDLATKAALKAYANVPDGNDLELMPNPDGGIMYTVTGPDGELINKGIATPQQLAASAMGLATGGFDKAILQAAGAREDTGAVKKGAAGRPQSAGDRAKESETVGTEIDKMKTKWAEKNKDAPLDEEFWQEAGDTAQHIMQQNKNVTASEAARAAQLLISPGAKDPEKPDFKVKMGEEGQPHTVTFGNKMRVQLDDEMLERIQNARAARIKVAADKINKDTEAADQPGFIEKAGEGVKQIASGVSKINPSEAINPIGALGRKAGSAAVGVLDSIYGEHLPKNMSVKDLIPDELRERVGSDLAKVEDLIRRNLNNPGKNPGAVPVDDNDRPL